MFQRVNRQQLILLAILVSFFIVFVGCGQSITDNNQSTDEVNQEIEDNSLDKGEVKNESIDESESSSDQEFSEEEEESKKADKEEENAKSPPEVNGELEVHYINVGQGDATLLIGPDFTILIDAGRHERNDVVTYLKNQDVSTIDLIIGTHPHADHIGQIDKVVENFDVKEVWMSGDEHSSQTFERVLDAILASDADYHEPRAGDNHTFGSAKVEVVNPASLTGNLHEGSVSVRIIYGDIKFLFTGDAEHQTERAMINRGHNLEADIFQLGHHGSSTSNTKGFMDAVKPEIAIYSAAPGNSYGHPHKEVIDQIKNFDIPLYGTDVHGNIIVKTDGKSYSVHTQDSGTVTVNDTSTKESEEAKQEKPREESSSGDCIDINSATKEELTQITHMGDARVEELINLRPFDSVDKLTRINGIGQARANDIKDEGLACVK